MIVRLSGSVVCETRPAALYAYVVSGLEPPDVSAEPIVVVNRPAAPQARELRPIGLRARELGQFFSGSGARLSPAASQTAALRGAAVARRSSILKNTKIFERWRRFRHTRQVRSRRK